MTQPERTPYCHKIRYGVTDAPDTTRMEGSYASGISIDPTLVELVYSAAREGKPASVSASVRGWVMRDGVRVYPDDPDDQMLVHFKNGPEGWPAWLAAEARLHDPDALLCICGHTEQQHFEDACLVCDCGDYLEPQSAREVIARYQQAVKRKPGDRPAVYAEVADRLAADAEQGAKDGLTRIYRRAAAAQVREWGHELRQAGETPAATVAEPGFIPPAAAGLPAGTLEAAETGANRLDAWARTPYGRNFLAHALVQLARAGWLREEPGEGFEPDRDRDSAPALEESAVEPRQDGAQTEADVPVHACPEPGDNGISSCCGRPPCEFVGERVTRDPANVTCKGSK